MTEDMVNHPNHYQDECGVECIEITEPLSYSIGNAVKYVYRWKDKGDPLENLKKAQWFLNRVIDGQAEAGETVSPTSVPMMIMFNNSLTYGKTEGVDFPVLVSQWKRKVLTIAHSRMHEGDVLSSAFFLALAANSVLSMSDIVEQMIQHVQNSEEESIGDYLNADHE